MFYRPYFAAAGLLTAGMIIADFWGCMGICSGIVTTSTWLISATTLEPKIAKVTAKLKKMKSTAMSAIYDVDRIEIAIDSVQSAFVNETESIIEWGEVAELLSEPLISKDVEDESFNELPLKPIFKTFTLSIDMLQHSAETFNNQRSMVPEKLNNVLNNQKARRIEEEIHKANGEESFKYTYLKSLPIIGR